MSGSVLAGIIQSCKAHNKCFTGSPQDATPGQGLHSTVHRAPAGADRGAGDFEVCKPCFQNGASYSLERLLFSQVSTVRMQMIKCHLLAERG